ncbi:MAG: hypothetical protein IPM93_13965 [Candidatus Obscuribacter sp.]|nr:hypothetical protein [Candidatus Obscuribacter sp.]
MNQLESTLPPQVKIEAQAKLCALTHNKSYPQEIVASDKIVPLSILVKGRNDEAEHDDSSEARAIGGVVDAYPVPDRRRKRILTDLLRQQGIPGSMRFHYSTKRLNKAARGWGAAPGLARMCFGADRGLAFVQPYLLQTPGSLLPDLVQELEKSPALQLTAEERSQLLALSASSVDRLLKGERRKYERSRSTTKRSSLVRSKVKVRTFTEWSDVTPGFFEIDTVAHCSRDVSGRYLSTLNMTDIATCWTEPIALTRKGSIEVIAALEKVLEVLPFPLKGLDSDNGSEFMNRLCQMV